MPGTLLAVIAADACAVDDDAEFGYLRQMRATACADRNNGVGRVREVARLEIGARRGKVVPFHLEAAVIGSDGDGRGS